jgi:hypothetical protein
MPTSINQTSVVLMMKYNICIGLNTWKGWKKDECQSRLFGTGSKEEEILVDHAEGGIHRSSNRPMA